jgi:hypothetical protein
VGKGETHPLPTEDEVQRQAKKGDINELHILASKMICLKNNLFFNFESRRKSGTEWFFDADGTGGTILYFIFVCNELPALFTPL